MGTKAVFAIKSKKPENYYNTIIGMTYDGTENNLIGIAVAVSRIAKELRCKTAFRKSEWSAISKVFAELVQQNTGWLFIDQINNAAWVNKSAIYNPKTNIISMYDEKFNYLCYDYNIVTKKITYTKTTG